MFTIKLILAECDFEHLEISTDKGKPGYLFSRRGEIYSMSKQAILELAEKVTNSLDPKGKPFYQNIDIMVLTTNESLEASLSLEKEIKSIFDSKESKLRSFIQIRMINTVYSNINFAVGAGKRVFEASQGKTNQYDVLTAEIPSIQQKLRTGEAPDGSKLYEHISMEVLDVDRT